MMRKRAKVIVILLMLAAVGVVIMGYTNEKTVQVERSWSLTGQEASAIVVKGLSQAIDIHIMAGGSPENRVEVKGSLP
ncbi:hypothetical protein [Paenibacillus sp. MMS20-IR301]|uniref:hypothetical protein n=1 Tax=Paenibacillus sp. MMS20-IR301 TaxID=2895946 RepID=UPI0028E2D7B2|nr:hypothetical protein [Paenibacillus sp. MMS20-IR301]WNS40766.1 hypothetical protein LOS79_17045 [Paenibacillus sp. MMS20-IR301]